MPVIGTREDLSVLRFRKGGATRYFTAGITASALTNIQIPGHTLFGYPFYCAKDEKFDRIAVNIYLADAGYARLGIYADNGSVAPGRLILDAGEVEVSSPTGVKEISISLELSGGKLYWLAYVSGGIPSLRVVSRATLIKEYLSLDNTLSVDWGTRFERGFTYAALPDPFGTASVNTSPGENCPVFLRKV